MWHNKQLTELLSHFDGIFWDYKLSLHDQNVNEFIIASLLSLFPAPSAPVWPGNYNSVHVFQIWI